MSSGYRDSEIQLNVDAGFALPDLSSVVPDGGSMRDGLLKQESVYFDTAEFDLLSRGVTVEYRIGDGSSDWRFTVPESDARLGFLRNPSNQDQKIGAQVISAGVISAGVISAGVISAGVIGAGGTSTDDISADEISAAAIPSELLSLSNGLRRGRPLRIAARLRTERHTLQILDGTGELVVEIADDTVTSAAPSDGGEAVIGQWREIGAASGPTGNGKSLRNVATALKEAGAVPLIGRRTTSAGRLGRALGRQPAQPVGRNRTAALLADYLTAQDDAIVAGDLGLRCHQDGVVHATRVAIRRFRSTIKVFKEHFDAERVEAMDTELRLYAKLLGEVRDREVQRERMAAALGKLATEDVLGPVGATIDSLLLGEQIRHEKTLTLAMSSRRYHEMLQELQRWRIDPPFTAESLKKPKALRNSLASAIRTVDKQLKAGLKPNGDDEQLHKARKSIKRARYAAELLEPELGHRKAKKVVSKYKDLQEHLGDHQDSVVAAELLRRLGATAGAGAGENGFTYGILYARELAIAETSRKAVRRVR